MVDAARAEFPPQMFQAAHRGDAGSLEGMAEEYLNSIRRYARERPEAAMLWALGIGFVLGWKLKPW